MSATTANNARDMNPGGAGASSSMRLFEVDPDLARFLTPEEHQAADALMVPVQSVPDSVIDVSALVVDAHAFGALVLDGMLVHHMRIADHAALRLLGSGDVFCPGGESATTLLAESRCCGSAMTRVALLGDSVLFAAHRAPRIVQGLFARIAEQSAREAAHLAISQLPRVDQRVMAIMWLLAEKWGHVTRAGTVLPLVDPRDTRRLSGLTPTHGDACPEPAFRPRSAPQATSRMAHHRTASGSELVGRPRRAPPPEIAIAATGEGEHHRRDENTRYAASHDRMTIMRQDTDASQSPQRSLSASEPLAYTANGNVRVLAFQRYADTRAIRILGNQLSAIGTSDPRPACMIIDTTGVRGPDNHHLATALIEKVHIAAEIGIPVAVVSSDDGICRALHRSQLEQLVITPTVRQAMQRCGTR